MGGESGADWIPSSERIPGVDDGPRGASRRLIGRRLDKTEAKAVRTIALRQRQVECLQWVAAGKTSAEIAIVLKLSRKTVDEHIDNACRAFGVNGRVQAVVHALKHNLISHP